MLPFSRSSVGRGGGDRNVGADRVQAHVQRHIQEHRQHVFWGVLRRRFNNARPVRVFILVKTGSGVYVHPVNDGDY